MVRTALRVLARPETSLPPFQSTCSSKAFGGNDIPQQVDDLLRPGYHLILTMGEEQKRRSSGLATRI